MTKLNLVKVASVKEELGKVLSGVSEISFLRDKFEGAMVQLMDANRAKSILNQELALEDLTDDEIVVLFRTIYNSIKDDTFNPDKFKVEVNKKKEMYHPRFKERFVEEHRVNGKPYAPSTKRVVRLLFKKVAELEEDYKKDIYEFNSAQFEALLTKLEAKTLRSLQNTISTLEQYINFAIEEGKIPANLGNVAFRYNRGNVVSQFLNKKAEGNMIFTKREIDSLSGSAMNAQDGVILNLLFDGVSPKRQFQELINLTIHDCHLEDNYIQIPELIDPETGEVHPERRVDISTETAMMIRSAMSEKHYASLKGNVSRKYKIADSEFVLRGLRNNQQIKWENISQRILRISQGHGEEFLTATTVSYSGQVHYAKKMMEAGSSIDEAVRATMQKFDINDNESAYFYMKARIERANQLLKA